MSLIEQLHLSFSSIMFWISWLIIPFVVEIVPKIYFFFYVLVTNRVKKENLELKEFPFISLIIPAYNSAESLKACIQSVADSTYPLHRIQVMIADNQSTDDIKNVYQEIQEEYPEIFLQYMNAKKGKASGMNAAIYHAIGDYIVNIDSDGVLEKHALERIVAFLEKHPDTPAVGGTILTRSPEKKLSFLQKNEFFEYCQVFLFGRQYASRKKQIFTLAGAFSAFRKEALYQTKLYNTDSIAEDTDMTFQIRTTLSNNIAYCQEAVYYTDSISNLQELMSQRERWQKGELEVVGNFTQEHLNIKNIFTNFVIRQMIMANTFAFLKMIWLFSAVMFLMMNFSGFVLGMSYLFLYLIYVILAGIYWIGVMLVLPKNSPDKKQLQRYPQVIITAPFYNFITFWMRLVGIINYFTQVSQWNGASFSADCQKLLKIIKNDCRKFFKEKEE